jgi:predicted secreted protein
MTALVGVDARVDWSTNGTTWTALAERNEFTISVRVDVAEHKVFVASLADAWRNTARTWMAWSGSLSGYYDDADDTIFEKIVAGEVIYLRFYDTRSDTNKYWEGQVILTNMEHSTGTDDYSTLSVDFEGQGALDRTST